jgi:hypothetical protein
MQATAGPSSRADAAPTQPQGRSRKHCVQGCATTVYGTVYDYTVRYGNTAYSRIYTVLDRLYGIKRYGVRYGPNFKSLRQKLKLSFVSALQMAK